MAVLNSQSQGMAAADQPTLALDALPTGGSGRVLAVAGEPGLRRRLLEMGLCGGCRVTVVRRAPLGDPIELELRGYHLSLRADQARLVTVAAEA
jgi:Fe2+ transport system protein FeoA